MLTLRPRYVLFAIARFRIEKNGPREASGQVLNTAPNDAGTMLENDNEAI